MSIAMSRAKKIVRRLLPAGVNRPVSTLYHAGNGYLADRRWAHSREGHLSRERLADLRARCRSQRCFVIGNGPSLTVGDLKRLQGEITIGSNGLFLLFPKMGYLPTAYTVEDRLVAEDRAGIINSLEQTVKIFPRDLEYCLKFDDSTAYINFRRGYPGFPRFTEHFATEVFWGGTVTFLNLQLAHYLGCREIYLVGVDHSYEVPAGINAKTDGVIVSTAADVNHFDPTYFGPGYRWHNPRVERMEEAYLAAKQLAYRRGVKIINATRGGKLEVFPRMDLDEVLRRG